MGERFEYDNPRLISIVHCLTETFKRFAKPENVLVFAFPWITKLYPKFTLFLSGYDLEIYI